MKKPKKTAAKKPAPKKPPAKATKPAKPAKKPRGKTAVFIPPAEPAVPTIDTPPPAEASVPSTATIVEKDADGREPIPGPTLVRALKYVHAVVPKEDGIVFYTHGADGEPIVSGHDAGASFTWFLPRKAVWELDVAVPRADSVRLLKLLEGLPSSALVRVYADCVAVIRHDFSQPEIRFALGTRVIVDGWQPPSKGSRPQAIAPLRMDAGRARKGRAVPEAIARSWQSADGIEWVDVSDQDTGETLARAVIAEDGRDLYPEDTRQAEFPGTRTVGASTNTAKMAVRDAIQGFKDMADGSNYSLSVVIDGVRTELAAPPEAPTAAEVTITTEGETVAPEVEALAPPDTTRLSMSLTQWLDLTDEQRATLSEPEPGAHIEWKHPSVWVFADVPNDLVAIVRATAREMKRWFREDIAPEDATATG